MNLLLRLARVLLLAPFRGRIAPTDPSVLRFRVWPGDLDVNLHMNNGRYLTVMDLGRLDLMARTGLLPHLVRRRWTALVGSAVVQFRRSLRPFARYELRSRVVGWDDRWFFIEQRFVRHDELVAVATVRALLRGRDGNVPPAEVVALVGHGDPSPPLSPALVAWIAAERALVDSARADRPGG